MNYVSSEAPDGKQAERWWESASEDEAGRRAWNNAILLRERDRARRSQQYLYSRLYGNTDPRSLWGTSGDFVRALPDGRLVLNVVARVIDAAVARVVVNRPKATFATVGGNFSLRRKGKLLERFSDAELERLKFRDVATHALTDAAISGAGCMHLYKSGGKACAERVYPGEVLVDPLEGLYGTPRTMYRVKFVPRTVAPSELGCPHDKEAHVLDLLVHAGVSTESEDVGRDPLADQVEVLEAWRLPDPSWDGEDEAKGCGKHIVALSTGVILEEPWKYDYFPILKVDWYPPQMGYWGQGIAHRLLGLQLEINKLLIRIQQAMHLMAVPRILAEQGSRIAAQQVNNAIGAILNYVGQQPTFMTAPSVHPEVYQHLAFLVRQAMEIAGTGDESQPYAPGVRSGTGQRQVHAQRNLALTKPIQAWDQLHADGVTRFLDIYREVDEETEGGFQTVAARDKYTVSHVKWSEVNMDRDQYVLRVYPTSALPTDIPGRYEMVSDMLDRQMIEDPGEARRLMQMPDTEQSADLALAAADNIDRQVENILDEGKWEAPEPYQDPALCIKRAQMHYNKACQDGAPEAHKQMLRDYMAKAHSYIEKAMAAAAAQQQAMQPAGPAALPPGPAGAPPLAPTGQEQLSI